MQKINILDKHFSQLIAAGEVVEKPASVVKELVENSIDSGATRISVEISHGGIKLIKITDNGSGIYRDDVKNAFLRHATSKMKNEADLNNITSLGFRGEALASICAVSKVDIVTRTCEENFGTKFSIVAGEPGALEDVGAAVGTVISVKDLFFNVPARMKFLKKDITEANLCAAVVDKLALSHPGISFKFIKDGKETMHTAGDGNVSSAVYGVYGKDFFSGMTAVNYEYESIKVSGYVSKPSAAKSTRNSQNFFINGRYVKSKLISTALEEAFRNSIMVGKFPYCVLYFSVPFHSVDVNVHPTKTEVKFSNEKTIFDAVYYAIKTALMRDLEQRPMLLSDENNFLADMSAKDVGIIANYDLHISPKTVNTAENRPTKEIKAEKIYENREDAEKPAANPLIKDDIVSESSDLKVDSENISKKILSGTPNEEKVFETEQVPKKHESISNFNETFTQTEMFTKPDKIRVVGEIFNCYIIVEKNDDMLLIDKHAAHERIIFEKMKGNESQNDAQKLLSPVVVDLEKDQYSAIVENLNILDKIGYRIEDFGVGSVVVREVPMYIEISEIKDSVTEISDYLLSNKKSLDTKKLEWLYDNISCRAAVKAGQKTSTEEIVSLVNQLSENPEIRHCPHGRPIFVSLSKKFIEKQFGRI